VGGGGAAAIPPCGAPKWFVINTLYGSVLDTVVLDLDNITGGTEVMLDVSAEVTAAVGAGAAKITFGFTSPDAIATNARNFFAFEGLDQGGTFGPNLAVDIVPEFDIADVNQDGSVDSLDFQQIAGDLFELTENLTGVNVNSDINGSGLVDFVDFRLWKNTPQGSAVFAALQTPEPATAGLLAMLVAAFSFSTRRRAC